MDENIANCLSFQRAWQSIGYYSIMCFLPFLELVFEVLAPRLSFCTQSDMVWQRVCWKLLQNVPERWLESVLTGLVQAVKG